MPDVRVSHVGFCFPLGAFCAGSRDGAEQRPEAGPKGQGLAFREQKLVESSGGILRQGRGMEMGMVPGSWPM